MKIWWRAVCDEHKEMCAIFVNDILQTVLYLKPYNDDIAAWMDLHKDCKLRLIYTDQDMDECFNKGYKSVRREG
jgi:hypothetical protein